MGTLSIVGTPIGNLEDITLRALNVLKLSDYILCEDTRLTKRLLDNYAIKTPTISYHQHSGAPKTEKIIKLLAEGKKLALVTDAGTPGISDPGSYLVSVVREKLVDQVKIETIPGPSALAAAISLAGSGFDRFLFLGFLPHKKGRQTMVREIISSPYPVVLYESKYRVLKFLGELIAVENESKRQLEVIVARELTKMHEQLYIGTAKEIKSILESDSNNLKGEFVIMIK